MSVIDRQRGGMCVCVCDETMAFDYSTKRAEEQTPPERPLLQVYLTPITFLSCTTKKNKKFQSLHQPFSPASPLRESGSCTVCPSITLSLLHQHQIGLQPAWHGADSCQSLQLCLGLLSQTQVCRYCSAVINMTYRGKAEKSTDCLEEIGKLTVLVNN